MNESKFDFEEGEDEINGFGISEEYFHEEWETNKGIGYSEDELKQPEEIHEEYLEESADLESQIKEIEELRIQQNQLLKRQSAARRMTIELLEMGLCDLQPSADVGTEEELQQIYSNQLKEFRIKRDAAVKRQEALAENLKKKKEYLSSKTAEYNKIRNAQFDLEKKTGLGMVNEQTKEKLTDEKLQKIISSSKWNDTRLSQSRLKLLSKQNKCKQLSEKIEHLKSNSIDIDEYHSLINDNKNFETKIEEYTKIISKERKELLSKLADMKNYSNKMENLKEENEKLEPILKDIKKEWATNITARVRYQRHMAKEKARKTKDWFADSPLLLQDYLESVKKCKQNKVLLAELNATKQQMIDYKSLEDVIEKEEE